MKHKIFTLAMGATMALTAAAQDLRTSYFMETSVNRHEMNPALLSESYVNIPLVLGNFNLGTTSNFGLKTFVYKMQPTWQGYGVDNRNLTTFMHPDVSASEFLGGLNDKSRLSLNLKYQLVGVLWCHGHACRQGGTSVSCRDGRCTGSGTCQDAVASDFGNGRVARGP